MENPNDDLPSVEEFLEEKNLPSVNDFLSKPVEEEILVEETIEEPTPEVEDLTEVLRLINDVRRDIPDVPEIKYYDEELKDICERITQIQEAYAKGDSDLVLQNEELESKLENIESKIPTVKYYDHDINEIQDKIVGIKEELNNLPEVRYYEQDLDSLKARIEQVNEAIPTFPDWVQEVQEVPDFSWIGKTFSLIDDDFNKVQGHLDIIREKIDFQVNELNETVEKKEFELKVDVKNLTEHFDKTVENLEETKDKLLKQVKDVSQRIWEQHHVSKDDDRKLKKSILGEQNKLKQLLLDEISNIDQQSVKADELILKVFTDLSENVQKQFAALPEVKYYDEDVTRIDSDITSLREELKELSKIANRIKVEQKNLQENYLLNEPPETPEDIGSGRDPLTPLDQKFATLDDLSAHYRLFINRVTTQLATVGGGGAAFVRDLDDVEFDATTGNNKLLIYNSSVNRWVGIGSDEIGNVGAAGTWAVTTVGIHTTKNVGIGTTAVDDKALYVLGDGQFTGNVTVGGTITYEDVKNVDSVGLVTARTGIRIGTGGTVGPVGAGIVTYFGDGSQLTGIIAGVGIQSNTTRIGTGFTDFNFTGAGVSSIVGAGNTITIDIPATTIRRQVETASGITTDFTINSGYTAGFIDVFLNGVKQRSGTDFTATSGTSVTMIPFVNDGDVLEFQVYENLSVSNNATRDQIQGYYGYTTDYYTVGVANTVQTIGAGVTTMIEPQVAEVHQHLPTIMTGVGTNPYIGNTATTIGTGQTEFSLAGLSSGASCIVRTALAFDPDEDNTNLDIQLKFTTNTATQGTGLTNFTILKENALIMQVGGDQQYISENLFSFFVGSTLEGTTYDNAGSFSIEVIPSSDGDLEVLAVTVNVQA